MPTCHSMHKDEIACYIVSGWRGHLVEVQGKTEHHGYVNILQQHLLASAVAIGDNKKQTNAVFWLDIASRRQGHRFPGLITKILTRAVTLIFRRYECSRYGNGMHHTQIQERATFECFITLSLCPTGLGQMTQGYCEVLTHVCLIGWQNFTVCKPTQQNFDGMCIRIIVPGCPFIKAIANSFWAGKISLKHREWLFSYNQVWRHRLRHIDVRNILIIIVLASPSPNL